MPKSSSDHLLNVEDLSFEKDKGTIVNNLCHGAEQNDRSRKGVFDVEIEELLWYLNGLDQYVSTSSCSGRVIIFSQDAHEKGKGSCRWHLACHSEFTADLLVAAVRKLEEGDSLTSDVFLKFEPFILHIRCKTLSDAQKLHAHSIQSGFRNSGITIRRKGKEGFAIHLAVRCTLNFEMPLILNGQLILSSVRVQTIGELLVKKMRCNADLTVRFLESLKRFFPRAATKPDSSGLDLVSMSTYAPCSPDFDGNTRNGNHVIETVEPIDTHGSSEGFLEL